jgi:DNA gyrase/topoisomerase IV subunit A
MLTNNGIVIRTTVADVRSYGRSTQGVNVMRVSEDDRAVAAMVLPSEEELDKIEG